MVLLFNGNTRTHTELFNLPVNAAEDAPAFLVADDSSVQVELRPPVRIDERGLSAGVSVQAPVKRGSVPRAQR